MAAPPTHPVLDESDLEDLLSRHRAFWHREPVAQPLLHFSQARYGGDRPLPGDAIDITPETVRGRAEVTVSSLRASYEHGGVTRGDFFTSSPFPTPPWMEPVLGCPIKVFENTTTDWREPLPGGWDEVRRIEAGMGGVWREALLHVITTANRELGREYPLGNPLIRAPIDCLAAMVGDEALCYLVVDEPDELRRVASICADIWLELTGAWLGVPNLAIQIDDGHILVEDGWTFQRPWAEVLSVCRKVQDAGHPLLLNLTAEHCAEVIETLEPRGLACGVTERLPD